MPSTAVIPEMLSNWYFLPSPSLNIPTLRVSITAWRAWPGPNELELNRINFFALISGLASVGALHRESEYEGREQHIRTSENKCFETGSQNEHERDVLVNTVRQKSEKHHPNCSQRWELVSVYWTVRQANAAICRLLLEAHRDFDNSWTSVVSIKISTAGVTANRWIRVQTACW